MTSRNLLALAPSVRSAAFDFLASATEAGLDVLIYCTYRSHEDQSRLYRQGRSLATITRKARELEDKWKRPDLAEILLGVGPQHGRKATNAAPGQSAHNYSIAFDGVPMIGGKPQWGTKTDQEKMYWQMYGRLGQAAGLEWAGNWRSFKEFPHMQRPGFDWREFITNEAST